MAAKQESSHSEVRMKPLFKMPLENVYNVNISNDLSPTPTARSNRDSLTFRSQTIKGLWKRLRL